MTTTTFWNETAMEPKRNYRFQVQILSGVAYWAKTCDTPSFDVTEVEHNYYDNKYYYPGRVVWNEIAMTVVDPTDVNTCYKLNEVLSESNYNVKSTVNELTSISKNSAAGALGTVVITVYNAAGTAVEIWTLKNAFLKSAKFGSLDYSSDELKQADLTIRYDWATVSGTDESQPELHGVG